MNWKEEYADKIVSVQEAVSHVQSGNRIVFHMHVVKASI